MVYESVRLSMCTCGEWDQAVHVRVNMCGLVKEGFLRSPEEKDEEHFTLHSPLHIISVTSTWKKQNSFKLEICVYF